MTHSPDHIWAADLPAGSWRSGAARLASTQLGCAQHEARHLAQVWGGQARLMTETERRQHQAWQDASQVEIVDLHDGPADQRLVPGVPAVPLVTRQLAGEARRRTIRRGHAPLPCGGLFDDTARLQQDLF